MNTHGKLALEHIEHTRCTGKDDGCSAYARADLVALLAHCERLEAALADALYGLDAQGLDEYANRVRAALAEKVTP